MPKTKNLDYIFLFSVLALATIGLIMIFSASPGVALKQGDAFHYLKRHLFYLLLGLAAMLYGWRLDLENLRARVFPIMLVSIGLLVLVFVPGIGRKVLGAARWIDIGLLSFQPSELIKFATVLFLAKWFSEKKDLVQDLLRGFLPPLILFGLISVLIMKQPDMGTAITIGATLFVLLFAAGANYWHLGAVGALGVAGALVLAITSPYRLNRLLAYLDPWQDPQGIGFHIIQSLMAVGSGGLFGLGIGASRQKFYYLPQQFTDFIFAILCEELGLLGGATVVVLFAIFAARGLRIALETGDRFRHLLAVGLVAWLSLQALINMMVVLGMIPTTGIPLPFISYGGTATIINFFAVGIILNISRKPS